MLMSPIAHSEILVFRIGGEPGNNPRCSILDLHKGGAEAAKRNLGDR